MLMAKILLIAGILFGLIFIIGADGRYKGLERFSGILILVGNVLLLYSLNSPSVMLAIIGGALGIIGIIIWFITVMREKSYEKKEKAIKEKQATQEKLALDFYNKCKKENVSIQNSEYFMLIAHNFNIDNSKEAKEIYKKGKELCEAQKKSIQEKQVAEKEKAFTEARNNDMKEYYNGETCANLIGKKKYLKWLTDEYNRTRSDMETTSAAYKSTISDMSYKAKESDWAIMGGLANGLAGPAAGLAAANDVQNRNEVAKRNAEAIRENAKAIAPILSMRAEDLKRKLETYQKLIDMVNDKICDESKTEERFKNLIFSDIEVIYKSNSKNVRVVGNVKLRNNIKLMNKTAILDGSLLLQIKDESGNFWGNGYYSPKGFVILNEEDFNNSGFSINGENIDVSCIIEDYSSLNKNVKLYCEIEPIAMWLIEK